MSPPKLLLMVLLVANVNACICHGAEKSQACMDELGCFAITDDFKNILYRPFNVLPNHRVTINTKFFLYTAESPREGYRLKATEHSINNSAVDIYHPTKFIVHGFMDHTLYGPWMEELMVEFLLSGPHNVIIVDWSGGNAPPYYQATANTRVVGAEIAHLITTMQRVIGLRPQDCHILGHSLGAHIAGYAGARLTKLGRITGLDPAEPYFQSMPPSVRLDPQDADFVDVIHTDSKTIALFGFGMSQLCGHVDFFPNNGKSQPGCKTDKIFSFIFQGLTEGIRRFVACDHQRAVDFFISSVNYRSVSQVGYSCTSWEDFLEGKCADCGSDGAKCAILGNRAIEYKPFKNDSKPLKVFLKTSGTKPFWVYHYQVAIKLFLPESGARHQRGTLKFILTGTRSDDTFSIESQELVHGSRYIFLKTTSKTLGKVTKVSLEWRSSLIHNFLLSKDLYVEYIRIVPMNVISREERSQHQLLFCDDPKKPIKNRETRHFLQTKC